MKHKTILVAIVVVFAVGFIAMSENVTSVSAKPADTYTLDWYTIDGGGTMSASGGTYSLGGTIGQFDAGTQIGGTYNLNGGFWGLPDSLSKYFLPVIMR